MKLPSEYVRYVETGGLLEAFTEGEPGYIALWPLAHIERNNIDFEVAEYAPEYLGFGGDGGGELLAFDKDGVIYKLPMIDGTALCAQGGRFLDPARTAYR